VKPLEPVHFAAQPPSATSSRNTATSPRAPACHSKIDPLGFALENFDPIGAWRNNYGRGRTTSLAGGLHGQLPDGSEFADIIGLKKVLLSRRDQFARCLTEKNARLFHGPHRGSRSTGLKWEKVVNDAKAKGYGLKDLLVAVVQSERFGGSSATHSRLAQDCFSGIVKL